MKKTLILIFSIITLALSFFTCWFTNEILDTLFVFYFVPVIILFIIYVILAALVFFELSKKITLIDILSAIILICTAVLVLFFPFREAKVNVELNAYESKRLEVIGMLKENKLNVDENGNVKLPEKYGRISASKEINVYQNDSEGQVIAFWIFRGDMSGAIELVYSTGGEQLIYENISRNQVTKLEKLKENWYYVEIE